ncbi:MAG: nucleotidyltransferase domain-containing protein [Roseburia sp.]
MRSIIIKNSSIKYQSFGIFGSYARNDYKASSDIDFCIK